MVVIEKLRKTVFDTIEELGPEEGYRTKIDYAQRLTWGGEFIHAAPWSEGQQGRVNVSHGCVNVSMADGAWLFAQHPDRRPDHGQGHRAQAAERQRLDRLEHELGRVRQGQRPAVRARQLTGSRDTGAHWPRSHNGEAAPSAFLACRDDPRLSPRPVLHPAQPTAFLTRAAMAFSALSPSSVTAYEVGQRPLESSRFAAVVNPKVE